jgi:hypothetical protein
MISRAFWFAVGTGAGVYGTVKARRLVYRLSPEGLADQVAALGLGLRAVAADVRDGMVEREGALLERLGLDNGQGIEHGSGRADGRRALGGASAATGTAPALAARTQPVRRDIP